MSPSSVLPPYQFSKETQTKHFWDELENNHLVSTQCGDCKTKHWPPKSMCNKCYSTNIDWVDLPTTGVLLTWSKVTAPPEGFSKDGYIVGIVELSGTNLRVFGKIRSSEKHIKTNSMVKLEIIEDPVKFKYFQFKLRND